MIGNSWIDYLGYLSIEAESQGISIMEAHQQELDAAVKLEEIMPSVEQLQALSRNGKDFSEY